MNHNKSFSAHIGALSNLLRTLWSNLFTGVLCALCFTCLTHAAPKTASGAAPTTELAKDASLAMDYASVGPAMELVVGKSTLVRLPSAAERISVGNPNIADITLISPTEIYFLGKNYGSTNVMVWRKGGATTVMDVTVNIDAARMQRKLRELLPSEPNIHVRPAADSVILLGTVSSPTMARYAEDIAYSFVRDINRNLVLPVQSGDGRVPAGTALSISGTSAGLATSATVATAKVVNLLQVLQGQQVMLEVKVAEISKNLLEKLGINLKVGAGNGGLTYGIFSSLLSTDAGKLFTITGDNGNSVTVDASKTDDLFKVLAEPNIIAISGQEASFLAGGKIFIPVVGTGGGGNFVTLQEREYGVGVKFTPTVLGAGRIHLRVAPEVSELGKGTSFQLGGTTYLIPNFTTNRVQTTVQLMDGQSLAIAGLIKNNVTESVSRIPLLGDLPILGALFRSSQFKNDRTELMFLITPRLVKPLAGRPELPTDHFIPPSRSEFFFGSQLEGNGHSAVPADEEPAPSPNLIQSPEDKPTLAPATSTPTP